MAKTTPQRAIAYVRVSKVGVRGDDLISPELQIHAMETWARANGVTIVDTVDDVDKSGRSFEKRQVANVIDKIKRGAADTVLLWKWSRWGRNLLQSKIYIAQVESVGGQVRAATEDFDPTTTMGKFTRDQMLMIAELQSNQISDGWKETHAKRRRDKLPHTGAPRWGYIYTRESGYQVDPTVAPAVLDAYLKFVNGTPMRKIAMELNELGIFTTRGNRWTQQTLGQVLDTGFAAGLIREHSDPDRKKSGTVAIHAYDVWREGAHESIISADLWDQYKALRVANAHTAPRAIRATYPLTGMLFCSECGSTLTAKVYGSRSRHGWVCGRRERMRNKGLPAHVPVATENYLAMAEVERWLEGLATEGIGDWGQRIDAAEKQLEPPTPSNLEALEARHAEIAQQRRNLSRELMKGRITGEDFDVLKKEVDEEIAELEVAIAKAKVSGPNRPRPAAKEFESILSVWRGAEDPNDQRHVLSAAVAGVVVSPGDRWAENKLRVVPAFS